MICHSRKEWLFFTTQCFMPILMHKYWVLAVIVCCLFSCRLAEKRDTTTVPAGWVRDSTTHFRLRAQTGVRSEKKLASIGAALEESQDDLLKLLGVGSRQQHLEVYFLKDRETLTTYTGYPANGYTDTKKGIIYLVDKDPFHLPLKHELMHALSWRLWGPPKEYWISEGLAVFAGGNCGGYPLHRLANAIDKRKKLLPFSALADTFDFRSIEPSLQAASMVQYIYDKYGVSALKVFWKEGFAKGAAVTGQSPAELEQSWLQYIRRGRAMPIDWARLKTNGCE
jgi:hypothetical protein